MSTSPKLTPTLTVVSPDAQKDSAEAVAKYLAAQEDKELLRFLTCGSVDDGKSTLIGRLLYDSRVLFEDHLAALENDSRKHGTTGDDIDLALLVDGLEAERQQGITIDVAYRFFATDRRKFIVADTPGHEQYTRNMATGASTAEVAVILVDARKGVLTQTRRHAYIANLLGIRNVVLAVNKIDLVDFDRQVFDRIVADFGAFASNMAFQTVVAIPMSARYGDNVVRSSERMPWYHGPHLLGFLETVPIGQTADDLPFRMPVQWVNRPNQDFRGYSGTIASGRVAPGDGIVVADNGKPAAVDRIVTMDGDLDEAFAGDAVTLTLDRELDIARGDMLAADTDRPDVADLMAAEIVWMNDEPMIPGRSYMMRIGTRTVAAHITDIKYKTDVNSFDRLAGKTLELNEIALCDLALAEPVAFDAYERVRDTGSFILIDRYTNATVGAGMVRFALRRAANIHLQALDVDKGARARLKGQRPVVLWFTGLSGSGKSTVANLVEKALHARGRHTQLLDGDNVRHGLNRDLSFSEADRVENIRRIGEVAKLFVDSGTIVLVSFISPYRAERRMARELVEDGEFIEIFVDTPLEVCKARDVKGLYAKAERGEIKNFTGISAPYEAPENPEITVNTAEDDAEALAERIVAYLEERGYLTAG